MQAQFYKVIYGADHQHRFLGMRHVFFQIIMQFVDSVLLC